MVNAALVHPYLRPAPGRNCEKFRRQAISCPQLNGPFKSLLSFGKLLRRPKSVAIFF